MRLENPPVKGQVRLGQPVANRSAPLAPEGHHVAAAIVTVTLAALLARLLRLRADRDGTDGADVQLPAGPMQGHPEAGAQAERAERPARDMRERHGHLAPASARGLENERRRISIETSQPSSDHAASISTTGLYHDGIYTTPSHPPSQEQLTRANKTW